MNELMFGIVSYMAGDIITLILGRLGVINLAPVARVLLKEAIQFLADKDGRVMVKERKGFKTVLREPTEDDLTLIKKISNGDR